MPSLRRLTVGLETYRWRVHHRHSTGAPCAEVFSVYAATDPRRPARIVFEESAEHGPGFPRQRGVIVDYARPQLPINLNRPRIARLLVELLLLEGWTASTSGEFIVESGFELLARYQGLLEAALSE